MPVDRRVRVKGVRIHYAHRLEWSRHPARTPPRTRRVVWVDVDYQDYATRVELDGRIGHVDEGAFQDRRRDNRATREGQGTLRYGHVEVFGERCGIAAELAQVLQARGWQGAPRPFGPGCPLESFS